MESDVHYCQLGNMQHTLVRFFVITCFSGSIHVTHPTHICFALTTLVLVFRLTGTIVNGINLTEWFDWDWIETIKMISFSLVPLELNSRIILIFI